MISRLLRAWFRLVLVSAFVITGCERGYKEKEEVVFYNPLMDPNSVPPDYVSRAIEAAGGRQAWMKTEKLEFDCVVTSYRQDGGFYITEQHHEIHPWSNLIRISAKEPRREFVWQLSKGQFSVSERAEPIGASPISVGERDFAEAILNIATAPARLVDDPAGFARRSKLVKVEGRWYYPIKRRKSVCYQNRDSSLVDMIWLFAGGGLAVRGYDYSEVEKGGVLVPTKIEIFRTDTSGVLKDRLAKIDYYALKSTEYAVLD